MLTSLPAKDLNLKKPVEALGNNFEFKDSQNGLKSVFMIDGILRYNFAYPHIYLRPADTFKAEALDRQFHHQGYIAADIDLSENTPASIQIVCDHLVLVGGTTYVGNGKNLEIRCRLLTFEKGPGANELERSRVTFDLSSVNSLVLKAEEREDAKYEEPSAMDAYAPGLVHRQIRAETNLFSPDIYTQQLEVKWHMGALRPARRGNDAQVVANPGKHGISGGNFTLIANKIDSKMLNSAYPPIFVRSNGSAGGPGQPGGNGSNGGDGLVYNYPRDGDGMKFPFEAVVENMKGLCDLYDGGVGGEGGHGGPGGRGGSGGNVMVICSTEADIEKKLVSGELTAGVDGPKAENGNPGKRGTKSRVEFYRHSHWNYVYDRLADDDIFKSRAMYECNDGEYPGIFPYENTQPRPILDQEQLWGLLRDKGLQPIGVNGTERCTSKEGEQFLANLPVNANFLGLLIQRLNFEHFVLFTSQGTPAQLDSVAWLKTGREAFMETFDWLATVLAPVDSVKDKAKEVERSAMEVHLQTEFGFLCQKVGAPSFSDAFQNSVNFVPWVPNKAAYDTIRKDYRHVESTYHGIRSILEDTQKDRKSAQMLIDEARRSIGHSIGLISKEETAIKDAEIEFDRSEIALQKELYQFMKDMEQFKDVLEKYVQCNVESIFESLSTVLMFGNGKSAASVVGSAISLGLGAKRSYDQSYKMIGDIKKEYLYGRMSYMTRQDDNLRKEIQKSIAEISKDGSMDEYRQKIVADKADFEEMCKGIMKAIGIDSRNAVQASFRNVIKAIDRKNKAMTDYNQAFVRIAEQQIVIAGLEQTIKKGSSANLSDDEVQILDQFSTRIYHDMARLALWAVYSRARAYNCISFRPTRIYDHLADLHSFSSVTSEVLDELDAILHGEVVAVFADWSLNPAIRTKVSLVLTDDKNPFLMEGLRSSRSLEVDIDHSFFFAQAEKFKDVKSFDFRMYSMAVYFYGAKSETRVEKSSVEEPKTEDISLHIISHGTFRYRYPPAGGSSTNFVETSFEFARSSAAFNYAYNPTSGAYSTKSRLLSHEKLALDVDGQSGDGHKPLPLQSPMGVWSISPAHDDIDISDVHKVVIEFDLSYRVV
ncbi:hypothetical protein EDD21DRAFT_447186 [Dissophora ornata]|nr:hypothetical protein EDD21DRAFT_447186 [Dissophora ornata]